jgi:hypothetical protein
MSTHAHGSRGRNAENRLRQAAPHARVRWEREDGRPWTARYAYPSSVAATEVPSHRFCVEIALRLAAAKRAFWRITGRGAPPLLAVTADHRRAKTPDRVLRRDERNVSVIGPVTLGALPRQELRMDTRSGRTCRHREKQRAQTDTEEAKGRSALHAGQTPLSTTVPPAIALMAAGVIRHYCYSSEITARTLPPLSSRGSL